MLSYPYALIQNLSNLSCLYIVTGDEHHYDPGLGANSIFDTNARCMLY